MNRNRCISAKDADAVFKRALKIRIRWDEILQAEVFDWIQVYAKATNATMDLIMPALISLTSTLCGPETNVVAASFASSLNTFLCSISPPGSGKSIVFERIVSPVLDDYEARHGVNIHLEAYTTAGIHRHQERTKGYGLITSDVGQRLLANIQLKGESERAMLCKVWSGHGDHTLLTGDRGLGKTSLGMLIFIQPHPLIQDFSKMLSDDGFMEKFLFVANRPQLQYVHVIRENIELLKDTHMSNFLDTFRRIDELHRDQTVKYKLTNEAQQLFDGYLDSYVEHVNAVWNSNDGDTENPPDKCPSKIVTSNDSIHVLRLAGILHVLCSTLQAGVSGRHLEVIPLEISHSTMKNAIGLFTSLQQQKAEFVQPAKSAVVNSRIRFKPPARTMRERLARAVCGTKNPITVPSKVQKKVNDVRSEVLKAMLEDMARDRLLFVHSQSNGRCKFSVLKPAPGTPEADSLLKLAVFDRSKYEANFKSKEDLSAQLIQICKEHHPQMEIVMDTMPDL